ncbi:MAG: hypothetical protein SW833_27640 [Cyanobacteriota bacterium]|nr:hypothetical protein [Cyanobacteriota bacterium]
MPLPTAILLSFFASAREYRSLEFALNQRGIPTVTVLLRQYNWLPTLGSPSMVAILRSIDGAVKKVLQQYTTDRALLARSFCSRVDRAHLLGRRRIWDAWVRYLN